MNAFVDGPAVGRRLCAGAPGDLKTCHAAAAAAG